MQNPREHHKWCIERAERYLAIGDVINAGTAFASDMRSNEVTNKSMEAMVPVYLFEMMNPNVDNFRRFMEGFNF